MVGREQASGPATKTGGRQLPLQALRVKSSYNQLVARHGSSLPGTLLFTFSQAWRWQKTRVPRESVRPSRVIRAKPNDGSCCETACNGRQLPSPCLVDRSAHAGLVHTPLPGRSICWASAGMSGHDECTAVACPGQPGRSQCSSALTTRVAHPPPCECGPHGWWWVCPP